MRYAASRSLSHDPETASAWPARVEDQGELARLVGESEEKWYFFHIPESLTGRYTPNLQSGQFPPLSFMAGGLGLAAFDDDSIGPRVASNLLLLAFVLVMAWHGWQTAGFRGAVLLGLAAAASPWVSQWLRFFHYQPGVLLTLSIALVAGHASSGLTRPVPCAWLGAALGVGLLFVQLLLFVAMPWLIALAFPDLFRTRYSLLAGGLLLLVAQVLWTRYLWFTHLGVAASARLDPYVSCMVLSLLLLLLGTAWLQSRKQGWRPATGLAVTVAAAGLVSSPYFLLFQSAQIELIQDHLALTESIRPGVFSSIWKLVQILHTFHWLGWLWLSVGVLVLAHWRDFRSLGFRLAFSVFGCVVLLAWTAPLFLKYVVMILPFALVLGFLWAARWKASFVGVVLLLLGGLCVQTLGWLYLEESELPWLPVAILTPDSLDDKMDQGICWFADFPVAELPRGEPWLWDQIPRGLRLSLLFQSQAIPAGGSVMPHLWMQTHELEYLAMFLSLRGQLIPPSLLREGDSVLIASVHPYRPPPGPRLGSLGLSAPEHFHLSDMRSRYPLLLQLLTVESICQQFDSGGLPGNTHPAAPTEI